MRMITITGKFESLNEYILACRRNPYAGSAMVNRVEKNIMKQLKDQKLKPLKPPIKIAYKFYETTRRRDKDNISGFFHKVFQDSLVKSGLLVDDGWKYISGYSDDFGIDKTPRVEIMIYERCKIE